MTDEAGGGDGEAGSGGAPGGRSMRKGRWRPAEEGPASGPMVTSTLSVKCTAAELEAFDAQCAALGVKRNRLMRALMRRAGGFVEADQAVTEELRAMGSRHESVRIVRFGGTECELSSRSEPGVSGDGRLSHACAAGTANPFAART